MEGMLAALCGSGGDSRDIMAICVASLRRHSAQHEQLDMMVAVVRINALDQSAYIFSFSFQHNMKNVTARC